jgi:hypothetical protein
MGNEIAKERFIGGFNSATPKTMLPTGVISGGSNVRVAGLTGGWKKRRGCTLRNTTADASAVTELCLYKNPCLSDATLLAHVGSYFNDLGASADALTQAVGLGTALGLSIGTTIGHSCLMDESLIYANSSVAPVIFSGSSCSCIGFVRDYNGVYADYTERVTDGRSDTVGKFGLSATNSLYICAREKIDSITFTISVANIAADTAFAVNAWRSGAWTSVGAITDGTKTGTTPFAKTGTVSWAASALDKMKVFKGVMGY